MVAAAAAEVVLLRARQMAEAAEEEGVLALKEQTMAAEAAAQVVPMRTAQVVHNPRELAVQTRREAEVLLPVGAVEVLLACVASLTKTTTLVPRASWTQVVVAASCR